ncbi:thioredoxin reductase [Halobacteriales archaeon QS_3_64_16]|nr:MAG: thioredoxin reductase [Halobacteriales archaeon QS_3_64_16]
MPIERAESDPEIEPSGSDGYDVVIVGGGVSGPSAGIFTARAGMDTCILDRGPSSLARCAYLANYLGFPGGIDVSTFRALCRAHADAAGCRYISDMVLEVRQVDAGDGLDSTVERETSSDGGGDDGDEGEERAEDRAGESFVVETQDGRTIETSRVLVATKDDTTYLEALEESAMFTEASHGGETHRYFDREYVDREGRTPIPGLYVAGPLAGCPDQAIVSAGHGARVGFAVIADWLENRGYPPALARGYWDWLSKEKSRDENWKAHARAFVERTLPEEASEERVEELSSELQAHTDALFVTSEEAERRRRAGHRCLLDHVDDRVIEAYLEERE